VEEPLEKSPEKPGAWQPRGEAVEGERSGCEPGCICPAKTQGSTKAVNPVRIMEMELS